MSRFNLRKTLSIGLAAALIFSVSLTVAAEENNYSLSLGFSNPTYNASENLIHGNTSPVAVQWNDNTEISDLKNHYTNWTDGNFVKGTNSDNGRIDMYGHKSIRIAYDLQNVTDISRVIFVGTDNGYADSNGSVLDGSIMDGCWNGELALYVSNDKENLFNSENQIFYENLKWHRIADIAYNDGNYYEGKYIGFEVFASSYPIYIEELIVFGTPKDPEPNLGEDCGNYYLKAGNNDPEKYNERNNWNRWNRRRSVKWDDGTDFESLTGEDTYNVLERWTDGKFEESDISYAHQITMGNHQSLKITYDLIKTTDIREVIFVGTDNGYASDYASVDGCWNAAIRVYVSDDADRLFDEVNKVTDIDNTKMWKRVFDINYKEDQHPKGRYIGFEVVKYQSYPIFIEELIVYREQPVEGDLTGDGLVNADDLAVLRKILLDVEGVTKDPDANLNGDANFDILDLIKLKKIAVNAAQ